MTKITINPDCGNSPKKAFIRDLNIAFAEGNGSYILDHVSEDIKWLMYGDFEIMGKEAFKEEIDKMVNYPSPEEFTLESIITHGSEAAVNGTMVMEGNAFAFCDIFRFQSAGSKIIVEIKSYIIKT